MPRPTLPRILILPSCLLACLIGVVLAGCDGRAVATDTHAPPDRSDLRIVALAPALGVIVRDLGLEDRIVGRHAWDMALPESVPTVGSHDDPDLEAILRLNPTHILVQEMETRVPASLARMAQEHGWIVWGFPLLTLDDIAITIDELALRLGPPDDDRARPDAPERPLPSARLAEAWSDRGQPARNAGRVLLLATTDPPGAMGPGSFHHQLIERLGARPALTVGGPWQELDHEDILRLAPDSIVLFHPGPAGHLGAGARPVPTLADARAALGNIALLDIPAVRAGRLALIDHPLGLLPASSLAEVADEIARAFDTWEHASVSAAEP